MTRGGEGGWRKEKGMKGNEKKEIIPRHGESANGQRILKAAREKKQAIYKTHTHTKKQLA